MDKEAPGERGATAGSHQGAGGGGEAQAGTVGEKNKKPPSGLSGALRQRKVLELARPKRRLVEVPYTATLANTANALLANRVSAVAVAAPPGHWIGAGGSMILEADPVTGAVRKHYIGMVNMLDVLAHIAEVGDEGGEVRGAEGAEVNFDRGMAVPVSSVIGHSLEGLSLWTLHPNTSILDCMETFSKGVHRALVPLESQADNATPIELVESSSSYRMLTQMDIIRFLWTECAAMKDILSSNIQELGAMNESVFAVAMRTKVIEAIKIMKAASLSAVPVVDARGDGQVLQDGRGKKLVETFSATDLRDCLLAPLQTWLGSSVMEFKKQISEYRIRNSIEDSPTIAAAAVAAAATTSDEKQLITCSLESTLVDVIEKAVTNHVHRVWVVDKRGLLLGIESSR